MKQIRGIISILAGLSMLATSQASSIVVNGGFEHNPAKSVPGYEGYLKGEHPRIPGWTVTYGGVTAICNWQNSGVASEGDWWLSLQTHRNGQGMGSIRQDLKTVIGVKYTLEFDYMSLGFGKDKDWVLSYSVAGLNNRVMLGGLVQRDRQSAWKKESHTFTATSTRTELEFTGDFQSGFYGPAIDNVRVTIATPKATGALIGMGDLTLILRKRK